jgi:hypothetical protein
VDFILFPLLVICRPVRCRSCGLRFYAFRWTISTFKLPANSHEGEADRDEFFM